MDINCISIRIVRTESDSPFYLMFLLDLIFTGSQRHWLRPMACTPADHSTLSKPMAGRGDFIWRHVSLQPLWRLF